MQPANQFLKCTEPSQRPCASIWQAGAQAGSESVASADQSRSTCLEGTGSRAAPAAGGYLQPRSTSCFPHAVLWGRSWGTLEPPAPKSRAVLQALCMGYFT